MTDALFTTRNRSFSQSSIRKRIIRIGSENGSQKQLTRNSTLTSFKPKLERLIQQGKIEQILNSDKHSKAKLIYSTHINDMQKQLSESKKSLSTMNLKAKSKQLSINKLKSEIARFQKQRQALKANNDAVAKLYENTISTLDNKKQNKQRADWVQKSYIHIKQRLLKDEYFHKNQYQTKQRCLEAQKTRSFFLQKKVIQINQQKKQLDRAIEEAKIITNQQTFLKNQLIDVINHERQEKEFLNLIRLEKQKKESQINQLSTWVIEKQELKKYLNILYTHRILSQIIRIKNANLIKKYSEVQSAYLQIKSSTNIIEFQKILKKMEEQDLIYDITVKKVSDLENELEIMQKEMQKAKRQRNVILSQQGRVNPLIKNHYQGMEKDRYELLLSQKEKAEHRIVQDDILKHRIIQWGQRLSDKLDVFKIEGQKFEEVLVFCVEKLKQREKQHQN